MTMGLLQIERRGAVATLTLNRPGKLNALPELEDGDAFRDACEAFSADPSVRCVVIRGRYRGVVLRIVRSLYELEVPLVAAVNGPAVGLGCDIAALADLRVASERAKFGVPFLKLGIIPGDG